MCHFWGAVLHATGGYRGDPIGSHAGIPGLEAEHFRRWMELFRATAEETLPPRRAADITSRAARMRMVLERHAVPSSPSAP